MRLFDTHCHITDERFDEDRDAVIARMREAGVELALVVGDAQTADQPAFELAEAHSWMYAATGLHPHDASKWTPEISDRIRAYMARPKAVALGEIGLDYHYDLSPREAQRDVFDAQMDMAYELDKPVILHIREAHGDATDMMLQRHRAGRMPRGVMHCYTGSWESCKTYLDMGLYVSFSGTVTFKNAPKLWEVAKNLPADRILVETDCPYMAPVPMRGQRNEPAFVAYTARRVAELRGENEDAFAWQALLNGCRLFSIPAPESAL
ncbi:MAG: TatD family hydrolase [Clostridia bacterium]|nr:TatD family hydrolase [Clostridia bacterium]